MWPPTCQNKIPGIFQVFKGFFSVFHVIQTFFQVINTPMSIKSTKQKFNANNTTLLLEDILYRTQHFVYISGFQTKDIFIFKNLISKNPKNNAK